MTENGCSAFDSAFFFNRLCYFVNVAYTFGGALEREVEKYFFYVKNNPKEEARFAKQTQKREALIAKGKTVEQLKSGAIDETGYAADADLATTATIYLGGYVDAIEAAVNNAQYLGAQAGDELKLAVLNSVASSASATAKSLGFTAQLYLYRTF